MQIEGVLDKFTAFISSGKGWMIYQSSLNIFMTFFAQENKCRLPSNVSESLPELIKVACAGFYSSCLSTPSSLSSGFKTSVAVKTLGRWWELSTEETGEHQQCSLRLVGRNHVPCSPYRNKRQCSITNHIASSYLITYIQKLQKHQI
ncbi:hypothetical protein MUK42_20541 [Musa troglodytarum]|uniref:Uncharacterized protein n=1 Tax=Musa troglodytarum TaxID=320322 RepID=A0A9E7FVV3_9LILI|nr:hypothetical protein MUK42_20541 [Musa troglodytarum]